MRPGRLLAARPIRGDELRALRELRMTCIGPARVRELSWHLDRIFLESFLLAGGIAWPHEGR
jgi:hypothetical protein